MIDNITVYIINSESNKEIDPKLIIRENDGEWREPLIEVEK